MRNRMRIGGFLVLALAACGHVAAAQDADTKELTAYRLTKEALDRYVVVMKTLMVEVKKDPRFQEMGKIKAEMSKIESKDEPTAADEKRLEALYAQLEQLEEGTEVSMEGSLSEIEADIRKNPPMLAALKTGGMEPREYVKFTLVLFQASMAVGMNRAGLLKEMPKEVSAENIQFIERHEKELEALQQQMKAMSEDRDR